MKNGYDQFFDKAKKTRNAPTPAKSERRRAEGKSQKPLTAEQYLRAALNVREETKRPRKNAPWTAIAVIVGGLALATLGYFYPHKFEDVLSQFEVTLFSQVSAAEDAEKAAQAKADMAAKSADGSGPTAQGQCPDVKGFTTEELSHFNKLNERKKELDLREAELTSLEEELHKQKTEIEARIAKLEQIREDVASVLKDRVEVDEQRVATLVDFYSNMKPKQAAEIIANLNEDLAVEVLGKMKKKNAADILNLLEPGKARTISEKFTGYKRR